MSILLFIISTFVGNTVATNDINATVHPLIQILQESFEQWQTLKQPLSGYKPSTKNPNITVPYIPSNYSERVNSILINDKRKIYEDFPSYDGISDHAEGEKKICKRYFTNDLPKKKQSRRKKIYYLNVDSKSAKDILTSLPEIYENKVIHDLKSSNFLSLPNKRSPNIKVLTIDLVPKGEKSTETGKKNTTQEIDQNSLLGPKMMDKGEFLILIQQPKTKANINKIIEDLVSSVVKKDNEGNGENSAISPVLTPQPVLSSSTPNVAAAVGEVIKLFMKSEAYYKDLSSRLNDFYTKIVEAKSQ